MDRKEFIKIISGASALMTLGSLNTLANSLERTAQKMPVLFIGHGSPMNGIETNKFSQTWLKLAKEIPVPKAVLCISAHWLTKGTHVTAMVKPKTIHDFGGFPQALFDVQYPAPGNPELAAETKKIVSSTDVGLDHDWGLDHGTWSVVRQMYPLANIPVLQLSIDYNRPAQYHYDLAKQLSSLRNKGVLIIGSGNMVHNLGMVDFSRLSDADYGFDWAIEMNQKFKTKILNRDHASLIDWKSMGKAAELAIPTPDHYYPLIYTLALQDKNESAVFFNDNAVGGSLTMTSVKFG
ncbi:MAG TPA: 4,5-DOPA dioxygenase extradiol [Bacteroidia bacterium]|nr:4,5-DOPA dioxygenase extradiol [Bacteroidota bacterium]MBP9790117.1 4,5-DOPA dioxygenase extradiol [Bacteroidia bacterium]MBK7431623.1 4,5-DOPA dioxygenase extradiol [Bacteroidota bacterium]MBK7572871.1 4,5-DOPA dioxygenase extradiol [Bacteroidota bacterium]MBP9923511.1 4,5-DOPA dioxygenase extradiol [Bacteroidia bacterium]